jgi:hypothetical protein
MSMPTYCIVHILQRANAAGMKAADMEELLSKCRKTIVHFKHSPLQTAKLSEAAQNLQLQQLSLVQDVTMRWFSALAMTKRFVSQIQAIDTVLDRTGDSPECRITDIDAHRLEQLQLLGQ